MTKIKSILVAYDFSEYSKQAILQAFEMSKKFDAKISVIHVLNSEVADDYVIPLTQDYKEQLKKNLEKDMGVYGGTHEISVADQDVFVERGKPHLAIIECALKCHADLIIIGSHGRSALSMILLGSVAGKVLRYSPIPVLVTRGTNAHTFKKVIVPLDDSGAAGEIIDSVKAFADIFNWEIQLFHAVDLTDFTLHMGYQDMLAQAIEKATIRLGDLKKKHGILLEPIVVVGNPAHAIMDAVKNDTTIGLIAMSTHGRSGLDRFVMGSTAESVTHHLPCSLLVIHAKAHRERVHMAVKKEIEAHKKTQKSPS